MRLLATLRKARRLLKAERAFGTAPFTRFFQGSLDGIGDITAPDLLPVSRVITNFAGATGR
jgi:hypothetical protein